MGAWGANMLTVPLAGSYSVQLERRLEASTTASDLVELVELNWPVGGTGTVGTAVQPGWGAS